MFSYFIHTFRLHFDFNANEMLTLPIGVAFFSLNLRY